MGTALLVAGCAALLPTSREQVVSPWGSFAEAEAAIEKIVPYETRRGDLGKLGISPHDNPNVTLLTYSDVALRFPIGNAVPADRLARGIRECLAAGDACTGLAIAVRQIRRDRKGNFWLDALNFRRETEVTGWSFNALLLLVDDLVVFKSHGGQPVIEERESSRQPLGPFQGWGETLPSLVR